VTGPSCVFGVPVACGVPLALQVPVEAAGTAKSSAATGPRRAIRNWLTANSPASGGGDTLPLYDLVTLALSAAGSAPETGERLVLLVSDGSPGCGQLASRPGFTDCNGCDHEWENPNNIITLVANAQTSPQQPVDTFLVGAPGADTTGANCNSPPYSMRAAFSAIAYSGAPNYVPTTCTGRTWAMSDPDPAIPCHSDQTAGGFSSASVGFALAAARAAVVGCRFQLPTGPGGTPLNQSEVNVQYRVGAATVGIPKRSSPSTDCSVQGCWDYAGTSEIDFFGHACQDAKLAQSIQVEVLTGCPTEVI